MNQLSWLLYLGNIAGNLAEQALNSWIKRQIAPPAAN